jgi:hypothetical protein
MVVHRGGGGLAYFNLLNLMLHPHITQNPADSSRPLPQFATICIIGVICGENSAPRLEYTDETVAIQFRDHVK